MVEDHDRIEALLDRILLDEAAGESSRRAELWRECVALIRGHLEIEDMFLLPAFELAEPEIGRGLRADHVRIRLLCGHIGDAIELQTQRDSSIMTLSRLLRGHHRREAMAMQQWARGMSVGDGPAGSSKDQP